MTTGISNSKAILVPGLEELQRRLRQSLGRWETRAHSPEELNSARRLPEPATL